MWSVVEVSMTIACACVASLKPLAEKVMPRLILNPREIAVLRHKDSKGRSASPVSDENRRPRHPDDMIHILTSGSGSRSPDGKEDQQPENMMEEYPPNVKLLKLLNLRPRRMLRLNAKQSIPPIVLVIFLFFLWGFLNGFVLVVGERLDRPAFGQWRVLIVQSSLYLAYLFGPTLAGRYILRRLGCTAGFVSGLYIFGAGSLLFWPSAVLLSFSISILANFTQGFGISILEATSNFFVSMCGPLEYAEVRLNIAQGIQGIASLVSRVLANRLVPQSKTTVSSYVNMQWSFLAIAFIAVILAVAFYYLPVPDAPKQDLIALVQLRPVANNALIFGRIPVVYMTLGLGVWSMFFFVAGHEALIAGYSRYLRMVLPK